MLHINGAREANLLGALCLAVSDRIRSLSSAEGTGEGTEGAALVAISTFLEGCSIEQLSRVVALSHSAAVRLADRLEAEGLVVRRPGADRRAVALEPTARGRARGQALLAAREKAVHEVLEALSAHEQRTLAPLLEALLENLVDRGDDPTRICRLCDAETCGHWVGRCPVTEARRRRLRGDSR